MARYYRHRIKPLIGEREINDKDIRNRLVLVAETYRKSAHISRKELAEKLGYTYSSIRMMYAKLLPPYSASIHISHMLDVSLDYLIYGNNKESVLKNIKINSLKKLETKISQEIAELEKKKR